MTFNPKKGDQIANVFNVRRLRPELDNNLELIKILFYFVPSVEGNTCLIKKKLFTLKVKIKNHNLY